MGELVAIVGDGQMGLVMADALAERGMSVRLWGPFAEDIEPLAETHRSRRLPEYRLPEAVEVTADDAAALTGAKWILNAIPTQFIRPVWQRLGRHAPPGAPVLCVSKGIENDTLLRPTQVIADVLGERAGSPARSMCALSGPTVAAELAKRLPATMVAASEDVSLAEQAQDLLDVPWLRIYRLDDEVGVELAGATKNVIALAAGMVDGLGVGDNAKSALLARGLAEIARLGVALGARVDTFFGVAGVGDLATTCFSPSGRNRTCGERLGKGETLDSILDSTVSVVEGVATTRSVNQLARRHAVDMPITAAVHGILFESLDPRDAIRALMEREQKAERIG
ncbi:MAG: NAD(P)H-dependent glycerol-3-phosphate dehydrogenase [Planctomycetota bacterium]|nr:NAD(P)H-dependent glycerol-3-phosphate dehydrogenase [Planctomycetota bacterium]